MSAISTITLMNAPGGSALTAGGKTNILTQVQGEVSVRRELNGTDQLSFTLQLGSPFHGACLESDYFSHRQTVKVEFADESVEYWVVNKADADYSGAPVTVECWPYWVQLDRRMFKRNLAPTGYADLTLSLVRVTPEEAITELLAGDASSVFTFGSVHSSLSSSLVSIELNNENHLTGLRKILRALAEDNGGYPAEFVTTWSGGTCSIHVVPWVGASAAEISAGYTAAPDSRIIAAPIGSGDAKTRIMNRMTRGGRDEFNRVIPVAGRPEELVTIARATWPVSSAVHSAGSTTITVTDTPFQSPGVFTGMYFGKDTFYEITAVNGDDEIVVTGDASALTEGRVALTSTGDELSYLQTSEASGDDVSEKAVQVDVAPYHNILEDIDVTEDMSTWVAGDADNAELPQGVGYKDADLAVPTITKYDKATYPAYVRDGDFSCHVNAVEGQGITIGEGVLSLDPSDDVPDHCFSVSISVISGVVRAVFVDSDGKRHPQGSEQVESDSKVIRALTVGGIPAAAGAAHLEVYAIGEAAEFVVNGVAVTNSAYAAQYSPQMGPRWIWKLGLKHLREQGGSRPTFETKFIDPTTYPGVQSSAEIGSWVRIKDAHDGATYQVNTTGRVQRLTHSYDTTGDPIIKLAQVTSLRPTFADRIFSPAARGHVTEQSPRSRFREAFESMFSDLIEGDAVAEFTSATDAGDYGTITINALADIKYGTLLEIRSFEDADPVEFWILESVEEGQIGRPVVVSSVEPTYTTGFEGNPSFATNQADITLPENVPAEKPIVRTGRSYQNELRQLADLFEVVLQRTDTANARYVVGVIGEEFEGETTSIENLQTPPRIRLRKNHQLVIESDEYGKPIEHITLSADVPAGATTIPIYSETIKVKPGDRLLADPMMVLSWLRIEPGEIDLSVREGRAAVGLGKIETPLTAAGGPYTTISMKSGTTLENTLSDGDVLMIQDHRGFKHEITIDGDASSGSASFDVSPSFSPAYDIIDGALRYPDTSSYAQIKVNKDNILLRVEADDIINQINLSTEGITIDGEHLQINTDTVIVDGSISADALAVATLSAITASMGALTVDDTLTMGAGGELQVGDTFRIDPDGFYILSDGNPVGAPERITWYRGGTTASDIVGQIWGDWDSNEFYVKAGGSASPSGDAHLLLQADGNVYLSSGSSYEVIVQDNLNLQDNQIIGAMMKDTSYLTNALGTVGATPTIDLESGNFITATVSGTAPTFTFSNPIASDDMSMFVLALTNGGSETITWPASVDWEGGTAPTLTASGVDMLSFLTYDAGTTWHGIALSIDSK